MYNSIRDSNNKLIEVYDCNHAIILSVFEHGVGRVARFDSVKDIDKLIENLEEAKEYLKIYGKK